MSLAFLDTSPKRTCANCGLRFTVVEGSPWWVCVYCQALWEITQMRYSGYLAAPQYRPPRHIWSDQLLRWTAQVLDDPA